jgi:type I restriction enzyme S subunit
MASALKMVSANGAAEKVSAPNGYQQTELGLIPEDWQCTTVRQLVRDGILEKPLDGNHGNIHPKKDDFVSFGIPFVMANNVQGGYVDLSHCAFIRKKQADSLQKGFSRSGDVLLTHKATIGNTAVVGEIPFEYIMLTPQVTYYRVADRSRLSNLYLRQFFESSSFQRVLLSMSGGGTRAYIGITAQLQLPIILPPTTREQEAIAETLGDADAHIKSLEGLIAKKRLLRQGSMQELLNGRKRLPGFAGAWEVNPLAKIAVIKTGGRNSQDKVEQGEYPFFVRSATIERINSYTYDCEAILVPGEGGIDSIFHYINGRFDVHQRVYAITNFSSEVSGKYIYFFMVMNFGAHAMKNSVKATVDSLRLPTFKTFEVVMPPTLEEQTAIARILSEMDAEIGVLESKLAKAQQLKRGMMQELLTGRIRLL